MRARVYVCVLVFHEIPFVVLGPSYPLDVVGCGLLLRPPRVEREELDMIFFS